MINLMRKQAKLDILKLKLTVNIEKYRRNQAIARDVERMNSSQTTRNIVNRAKEVLVKSSGISEMQALCRIQVLGYDKGVSIRDMAQEILRSGQYRDASA